MQKIALWLAASLMLLWYPVPAAASAARLRAEAEAFAGRGVVLDPRVRVPDCPVSPGLRWRDAGATALIAECAATGWQLVLPVATERTARPAALVRRGDPVTVRAVGNGFSIRLEGVAEGEGRPGGRLMVRNLRSGERVSASVAADGQLWLAGQPQAD